MDAVRMEMSIEQQDRAVRALVKAGCRMSDGEWTPINGNVEVGVVVRSARALVTVAGALVGCED